MELVIPLIEESLVLPAKEFFEEDGLALYVTSSQIRSQLTFRWQVALYNATSPYHPTAQTGLIRLMPGLLAVLSENMDLLDHFLALLDSYLLLDAPGIVRVGATSKHHSQLIILGTRHSHVCRFRQGTRRLEAQL